MILSVLPEESKGADYTNVEYCPIARAFCRVTGIKPENISVSPYEIIIYDNLEVVDRLRITNDDACYVEEHIENGTGFDLEVERLEQYIFEKACLIKLQLNFRGGNVVELDFVNLTLAEHAYVVLAGCINVENVVVWAKDNEDDDLRILNWSF